MNPSEALRRSSRPHLLPKLGTALGFALLSIVLTGCWKMSSEAEALRDSLMKSAAVEWDREFEIGVGALTLNLARAGLAFIDLDHDARAALNAIRGADVGIYRLHHGRKNFDHATLLSAADDAMAVRGCDRAVAVVNQRELVAVYVPRQIRSTRNFKVFLVVLDGRKMVIVSARNNLELLIDMALRHSNWLGKDRFADIAVSGTRIEASSSTARR